MNQKLLSKLSVVFLLASINLISAYQAQGAISRSDVRMADEAMIYNKKTVELQMAMRKLGEEHVNWTRLYIISSLANLPDKEATGKRLMQNQTDLGAALEPFYGAEVAKQFTQLLTEHIAIADKILVALLANDATRVQTESTNWLANADAISLFLSKINSFMEYAKVKEMMNSHLSLTTDEIKARMEKNWDKDVETFDKVQKNVLEMSDCLTMAIIKAFPEKFVD